MLWYLQHLWNERRFRRKWRRIYNEAIPVEGIGGLYISFCPEHQRPYLLSAVNRVWPQVPVDVQDALIFAWGNLQKHWDDRKVGIPLRLPICGIFRTSFDYARDQGGFAGRAARATRWNGYSDSGSSLMKLFANMYMPLCLGFGETPPDLLPIETAKRLASYYLCVNHGVRSSLDGYHANTDALVASWEFSVDE